MKVKSSAIESVTYSRKEKTLLVTFVNGGTYLYLNVSRWMRDKLVKAQSIGKAFHGLIRGKYKFIKVTSCNLCVSGAY